MFTIVAGTGYTGRRVLERLPADEAMGLTFKKLLRDPDDFENLWAHREHCIDFGMINGRIDALLGIGSKSKSEYETEKQS